LASEPEPALDILEFAKKMRALTLFVIPGVGVIRPLRTSEHVMYMEFNIQPSAYVKPAKAPAVEIQRNVVVVNNVSAVVVGYDYKMALELAMYAGAQTIPVPLSRLTRGSYAEAYSAAQAASSTWARLLKQAQESGTCRVSQ
jgi:hypothetical protein